MKDSDHPPQPRVKRLFDLCTALILSPVGLFVTVILSAAIWLEDRRNPIFRQQRVGTHGQYFTLFKLRTMSVGSPNLPSHEVGATQVTRVGRLLRKSKLDELPQIWNVIRGDMSWVGPRPCLPSQHELIARRKDLGVLNLRPGITGPAQIAGIDMAHPERLAVADAAYLGDWSLARDIYYLFKTFIGRGAGDAVR